MKKEHYFLLETDLNREVVSLFKEEVLKDDRFIREINENLITIEEGYFIYGFFTAKIVNQEYLIIRNEQTQSAAIDAEYTLPSKDFLLRGLKRDQAKKELDSVRELKIFNLKDISKQEKNFLKGIQLKAGEMICERHNLFLKQKGNRLDVAPIRDFDFYEQEFYLEKVYQIHYRSKTSKKDLVSIYSAVSNRFYQLNFLKTKEFEQFYKKFKRPLVFLPEEYQSYYEKICYDVYEKTIKELNYLKEGELLKKIRQNISYPEYSKFRDYLFQGIFYFRKKELLKYYPLKKTDDLQKWIFDLYLTLSFQEESGYELAQLIRAGLLEEGQLSARLEKLNISYRLGNIYAKKELYEHYSHPMYYDENVLKRYS